MVKESKLELQELNEKAAAEYTRVLNKIAEQKHLVLDIVETVALQVKFLDDILYNEIIDLNSIFWHLVYLVIVRHIISSDRLHQKKSLITGRKINSY
jgi:hypothetical protein